MKRKLRVYSNYYGGPQDMVDENTVASGETVEQVVERMRKEFLPYKVLSAHVLIQVDNEWVVERSLA